MVRLKDVTLEQAYKYVRENSFAFSVWTVEGNYLGLDIPVKGENVKTCIFLSGDIFLLGLSVEIDGFTVMASKTDFLDIWFSMERKYPRLFDPQVRGTVMLIP